MFPCRLYYTILFGLVVFTLLFHIHVQTILVVESWHMLNLTVNDSFVDFSLYDSLQS